ncbi:MAG: DegV family protein, partial [Lachnospiraceae bacterium]|nr:DegV family protein [Lachnospiraceae bacterium]
MSRIAVITDSNSGITQAQAEELSVFVLPMPFMINEETYFEDINLT